MHYAQLTLALFEYSALEPATLRNTTEGKMKAIRLPIVAPVKPNTVSTGMKEWNGNKIKKRWDRNVVRLPLGIRMATMRVKPMMAAVMATNLFLGMGSCTCSSRALLEKKRELMLARQGKIIRGKLTTTDKEKPAERHGTQIT